MKSLLGQSLEISTELHGAPRKLRFAAGGCYGAQLPDAVGTTWRDLLGASGVRGE